MAAKKKSDGTSDFNYEIIRRISILSMGNRRSLELNYISFNGAAPKYDLRWWIEVDGQREMLKGVTMSQDEIEALREAIDCI